MLNNRINTNIDKSQNIRISVKSDIGSVLYIHYICVIHVNLLPTYLYISNLLMFTKISVTGFVKPGLWDKISKLIFVLAE